jgi:hypothetical protein
MIKSVIIAVIVGVCFAIISYSLICLITLPSSPNVRIKKQIKTLIKKREVLKRSCNTREANEVAYEIRRLEKKL